PVAAALVRAGWAVRTIPACAPADARRRENDPATSFCRHQLVNRVLPFPAMNALRQRLHADAIDRTGRDAQLATGAFGDDDGVHLLGGADDRIDRAGLQA